MSVWLDTETKALMQQLPPKKCAPPDTGTFTLVLLQRGTDATRVKRFCAKVPGISDAKASDLASQSCPLPVARGLSIADAVLGQFELVCGDCISVFLGDEIMSSASQQYLSDLYWQLRQSAEFDNVSVTIEPGPDTDLGQRFLDQFVGGAGEILFSGCTYQQTMLRKKARIMKHWAKKIGITVTMEGGT